MLDQCAVHEELRRAVDHLTYLLVVVREAFLPERESEALRRAQVKMASRGEAFNQLRLVLQLAQLIVHPQVFFEVANAQLGKLFVRPCPEHHLVRVAKQVVSASQSLPHEF